MPAAPTIETPRLLLRPWRKGDADAWAEMWADPRVVEFMGAPRERVASREQAARLAAKLEANGYGWWVVEVKASGAFAGAIILQDVPFAAHFTPALEVGWHFAFAHWKHGYATEGGSAALRFAFERLGRDEVVAITSHLNVRSQAVMERIGMTRDPDGDFDNPFVPTESPLLRHVLYRARAPLTRG
jgi:RimJ/RimL family protein N-acetyltransferase